MPHKHVSGQSYKVKIRTFGSSLVSRPMRFIPYRDSSETNDIWLKRGASSSKATTGVDAYKTANGNDMNGFNNGKTRADVYNKVTINGLNTGTSTVVCLNMHFKL